MSQHIPDDYAMLPSSTEREKIFYWLKKLSSVTAWRRILQFYNAWVLATENSVRIAEASGWGDKTSLPQMEYALILKHLAHCEEGVRRLAKGDKRVFKFDAQGEFEMAWRIVSHWSQMMTRIELRETGIDEVHTPHWEEFHEALTATCRAWQECSLEILEPRYLDEPALTMYGRWLKKEFLITPFPDRLRPVPDPVDNIFVRTNDWTPYSGIWEPVEAPKPSETSLLNLLARAPRPQSPFKIVGTMNYLHGGSKAPRMRVQTINDTFKLGTTWRLLWRDDRYIDGTVPEEEADYLFTEPKKIPPQSWIVTEEKMRWWAENVGTTAAAPPRSSIEGGGLCSEDGYYFTPAKAGSRRYFKHGEHFPNYQNSSIGKTFWQWDVDQTESSKQP